MKVFKLFLFFLLNTFIFECEAISKENSGDVSFNNYIYCNVYMSIACFGIAQSDVINMEIPTDYVLYQVSLASGVNILIYNGYNPEAIINENVVHKFDCGVNENECVYYKLTNGQWLVRYKSLIESEYIQLSIIGLTSKSYVVVKNFLNNFRECRLSHPSINCTEKRLFEKVNFSSS